MSDDALARVHGHDARAAPMRASSRSGAKRCGREQHELGEVVVEARAAAAAHDGDAASRRAPSA